MLGVMKLREPLKTCRNEGLSRLQGKDNPELRGLSIFLEL